MPIGDTDESGGGGEIGLKRVGQQVWIHTGSGRDGTGVFTNEKDGLNCTVPRGRFGGARSSEALGPDSSVGSAVPQKAWGLSCARHYLLSAVPASWASAAQVIAEAWWFVFWEYGLHEACDVHVAFPLCCQLPVNVRTHLPQSAGGVCILVSIISTCFMFLKPFSILKMLWEIIDGVLQWFFLVRRVPWKTFALNLISCGQWIVQSIGNSFLQQY